MKDSCPFPKYALHTFILKIAKFVMSTRLQKLSSYLVYADEYGLILIN